MDDTNVPRRERRLLGKRVTVRLPPQTYAGLTILKHDSERPIYKLVQDACAAFVAARLPEMQQ
jgi:hypothetical protein